MHYYDDRGSCAIYKGGGIADTLSSKLLNIKAMLYSTMTITNNTFTARDPHKPFQKGTLTDVLNKELSEWWDALSNQSYFVGLSDEELEVGKVARARKQEPSL